MFSGRHIWILFALPILVLLGCSRPEGETSTIKIVVPQAVTSSKAQAVGASDKLAHVIINVTGDGIAQPILITWDGNDSGTTAPPPSFSLSIPMGSNRLFQVLAVYKNSSTNVMTFYYGDQVKSLSQTSESVTVPITSFSTGAISGSVFGRYLDTATSGPTGMVSMRFDPGNGKPPLLIDRSMILDGWFSFFMLTGTPFQYVMDSGRVLFGGPVSLDDTRFKPAANNPLALRVTFPSHQRMSSMWESEEAEIMVYGWFADPTQSSVLSGKAVCRPSSIGALSKMTKYDNTAVYLSGVLDSTLPTSDALQKIDSTSLSQFYVNGGVNAASDTKCLGPNVVYDNFLNFLTTMVDGNGKDGASPFVVPFTKDTSGNAFTISTGAANRVIQMQLLPGLIGPVEGVKIFKKVSADEIHADNIDCLAAAGGANGFVDAGSGTATGTGAISVNSNITSAEATSGVSAAVCPIIGGKIFPLGALINKWQFSGGGGGYAQPADGYQVKLAWNNIVPGQCHDARIDLTAAGSYNATNSQNLTFNLSLAGISGAPTIDVYAATDTACATSLGTTVALSSPATYAAFRFKVSGGTSASAPQLDVATSSYGSMTVSVPIQFSPSASAATSLASQMQNYSTSGGVCQAVDIYRVDSFNYPAPSGGAENITTTVTPSLDLTTYTDAGCTAAASTFTFNTGEFSKRIYVKRTAGSGEASINFADSGGLTAVIVYFDAATWVDHLKVEPAYNLTLGTFIGDTDCLPLLVKAYDNTNTAIAGSIGGAINLNVNANGGGNFYTTQSSCYSMTGGGPQAPITIGPATAYSSVFWYRNSAGGTSISLNTDQNFRVSNSAANVSYSIPTIPYNAMSTPNYWFDISTFVNQADGTGAVTWTSRDGVYQMADAAVGSAAQLTSAFGGPWRTFQFSGTGGSGSGISIASLEGGTGLLDFTIVTRVRFNSTGATEGILQLYGSTCNGSTFSCALKKNSDGSVSFLGTATGAGMISDTNFHTIMVVRSGANMSVYLDSNTPIISTTLSGTQNAENYTDLKVGYTVSAGSPDAWLNGNLSDIIIYNTDNSATFTQWHSYLSQKTP